MLPGVQYEPPQEMPLSNLREASAFLADTIKKTRMGLLPPKIGQTISQLMNQYIKVEIAIEKLDPQRAARREVTREELIQRMRSLTPEQAREIALNRNRLLIEQVTTDADVEDAVVLDIPKDASARVAGVRRRVDEYEKLVESGTASDVLGYRLKEVGAIGRSDDDEEDQEDQED